mgnify:CR=1 FL=1
MKQLQEILDKISYCRTMLQINPNDFFRKGQLENLLWILGEIQSSRAFREWRKIYGGVWLKDAKTNEVFRFVDAEAADDFTDDYENPDNLVWLMG